MPVLKILLKLQFAGRFFMPLLALGFASSAHAVLLVNSTTATNITQTTARLISNVTNTSGAFTVPETFQWGLTGAYGNTGSTTTIGTHTTQNVIENISGLTCGTTYHYAVTWGPDTTFTTSACGSTVTYNANGGSGAPTDGTSYTNGSTVTVSATQPTRPTYTFTAWNTASNGSGSSYQPSATFTMGGSNVTLYAQWLASQAAFSVIASPSTLRTSQTSTLSTSGGSGSGAVTYAVTSGPCSVAGNTLTANDRGSCLVTATKAADSTYIAATATTTVTVSSSLAQAIDQTVKNTVMAQGAAAIRTTESQLRNVNEHLNRMSLGFNLDTNRFALNNKFLNLGGILLASAGDQLPAIGSMLTSGKESTHSSWIGKPSSMWIAGDLSFGQMDASQAQTQHFSTNEVTVGLDILLAPKTIIGAALSYSKDTSTSDNQGSGVNGQQRAISLYGVTEPQRAWLIDGQIGFGTLAFDNSRYSALADNVFLSSRHGHTLYVSGGVRKKIQMQGFGIEPFVRAQYIKTKLAAYDEGSDPSALAFDRSSINTNSIFVGVESFYDLPLADGSKLTPSAKVEYRRNSQSALNQAVSFAQDQSEVAAVGTAATPQDVRTVGLAVRYTHKNAVSASLNWQFSQGSSGYQATGLRAEISIPF